jgi:hypothetical protein
MTNTNNSHELEGGDSRLGKVRPIVTPGRPPEPPAQTAGMSLLALL